MKNHRLYEVNIERQTAFCVVCGYTEIYVRPTRTRATPQVICLNRYNEQRERRKTVSLNQQEESLIRKSSKPKHILTEIDPIAKMAICAECGPTDIRAYTSNGHTRYTCATNQRQYMRKYRRSHYVGRSHNPHALSQIDEDKETAVCATCGPVRIEIEFINNRIFRRCVNSDIVHPENK
jgi:hypothetical protein